MTKAEHAHCHDPALAYSYEDAAFQLGKLSRRLIAELVEAGKLRPINIAGRKAIPHAELERFVAELQQP